MSQILLVTTSPRADSLSTKVAQALVAKLEADTGAKLVVRDLATAPIDHVGEEFVTGRVLPTAQQTPAQAAAIAASDVLVTELLASDTIVIASPMYNFGVPSTLKAWIDNIARPGVTFSYGEGGPRGLVTAKKVYLVEARGGVYSEGPYAAYNFQEPYLRTVLAFLGMTDVETILVEGIGLGPDAAQKALEGALGKVAALAA